MKLKMESKMKNKYEALGFAEALIAIMITGVAATVLMTISANSMKQLMQIEDMDKMAQLARSGAVTAQKIADEDEEAFEEAQADYCYAFNGDTFDTTAGYLNLSEFRTEAKYTYFNGMEEVEGPYSNFFRVICIQAKTDSKVGIKIVTGLVNVTGAITNSTDTKDYSYYSIINL